MIVRAPSFVKDAFIHAFIKEKSAWLKGKISAQQQARVNHFDFSDGSELLLLGEKIKLVVCYGNKNNVYTDDSHDDGQKKCLVVVLSERNKSKLDDAVKQSYQVKKQLEAYLKELAKNYIDKRLTTLSVQTSLFPEQVKIRQYRARWGSCNNRKEVSFNYLLMLTPTWVIDYVIIHELCHLTFLNHSPNFWSLVSRHYPHYQEAKLWLRNHQSDLIWQLPT